MSVEKELLEVITKSIQHALDRLDEHDRHLLQVAELLKKVTESMNGHQKITHTMLDSLNDLCGRIEPLEQAGEGSSHG